MPAKAVVNFTPQEVSELLTKISLLDNNGKMKTEVNKVYDPAVEVAHYF